MFHELRDTSQLKGNCGGCEFRKVCRGCSARAPMPPPLISWTRNRFASTSPTRTASVRGGRDQSATAETSASCASAETPGLTSFPKPGVLTEPSPLGSSRLLDVGGEFDHFPATLCRDPPHFLSKALGNVERNHLCHSILRSNTPNSLGFLAFGHRGRGCRLLSG